MDSPQIAFLHVGPDITLASIMVRSIRAHNSAACIIQCSDEAAPEIPGISRISRIAGDTSNLMTFRLESFARLNLDSPAIYLDTDMLVVDSLNPAGDLQDYDVAVCSREFTRSVYVNTSFRGMDLSEYAGKTFGEVYPYVACATITKNGDFWSTCLANLKQLNSKFHFWYGDQEAIRNVVASRKYRVKLLPESVYACLPNQQALSAVEPRIYHFKGYALKKLMIDEARKRGF